MTRQLQAWWDVHAYYPRHASSNDEGGTVKLHLLIQPDGRIWSVTVTGSSGSNSLDAAAVATFRRGFVRPFAEGAPDTSIDLSLHYVLAHRHDQPVVAGFTPASFRRSFTITNDPVKSPILDTMLQRACTGEIVKEGIRNHPAYGVHYRAQAVFFRKPDGTPWVKFFEGGYTTLAPVTEVGRMVQWTGREEHQQRGRDVTSWFYQYTLWSDGHDTLSGNLSLPYDANTSMSGMLNHEGTADLTCATESVPTIEWSALAVTPGTSPAGDPP